MKKQQDNGALPWVLLTIPVLWIAAIIAYAYEDGMNLFDLLGRFTVLVERPFAIGWTAHTPKFMLIGLILYGCAAALYLSTKENRRPGEEHGSARWGSPRQLCAKYRDKHYLYLDEAEWRRLVFYLNEFRNKLIAQGRYTDCMDELLVKTISAKTVKI